MGINIRFLILQIFQLGVFFCRGVTHLLLGSAAFQPGLSARAVRGAARARPHRRRCRRLEEGAEIQMRRRSEFNQTQSRICKIEFYIYTVLFLSHCLSRIHVLPCSIWRNPQTSFIINFERSYIGSIINTALLSVVYLSSNDMMEINELPVTRWGFY